MVSGILFDPKDDDKHIRPEGAMWQEISDAEEIASIVDIILSSRYHSYFPNLYQLNGPEGDFYGYLVTGWMQLSIRDVDDQTVRIYGLNDPPEYLNGPDQYRFGGS